MSNTPAHYPLSSSGSSRWIACPGSKALEEQAPPDTGTEYSEEGTKAHAIGEEALLKKLEPIDMLDRGPKEMLEAVQVYVDYVNALASDLEVMVEDKIRRVEVKFSLGWVHKDLGGTSDCYILDIGKKTLHVIDYKHGKGVVVEPEWNSQLLIYALGALTDVSTLGYQVEEVVVTIVQPRAYHNDGPIRSWNISAKELMFWALNVLKPAAMRTDNKEAPLATGAHCRFCKARAFCPKLMEEAQLTAQTNFQDPVLPPPSELSSETVLKILNFAEVFTSWVKDVEQFVLHQMKSGQMKYPGFKLVRTTKHRKWKDPKVTENVLTSVIGELAYKKDLVTPSQAESILKSKNISPEATLKDLWEKPEGDLTVAPVNDKRKEVEIDLAVDFPMINKEENWYE